MATFSIESLTVDGERIPFTGGKLDTLNGTTTASRWEVRVDGAATLRGAERDRVHLRIASPEAGVFEGDAMIAEGGHRDQGGHFSGLRYEGLGPLQRT